MKFGRNVRSHSTPHDVSYADKCRISTRCRFWGGNAIFLPSFASLRDAGSRFTIFTPLGVASSLRRAKSKAPALHTKIHCPLNILPAFYISVFFVACKAVALLLTRRSGTLRRAGVPVQFFGINGKMYLSISFFVIFAYLLFIRRIGSLISLIYCFYMNKQVFLCQRKKFKSVKENRLCTF